MFQISNNYKGHWTSDTSDYCHDTTRDMALKWSKYYVLLIQDTNMRIPSNLVTRPTSDHKLEETIWVRSENSSQLSTLSSPGKYELLTSCVTACSRHPDCSSHTWHRLCQAVCICHTQLFGLLYLTNNFYFFS